MPIDGLSRNTPQTQGQNTIQAEGRYSNLIPRIAKKANMLALGAFALYALANIPVAEAGAGSYWACIQTCLQSAGPSWITTFVCPTICAPFLLAPG